MKTWLPRKVLTCSYFPIRFRATIWPRPGLRRRFAPDWIVSWSLSNMHVIAARNEAYRHRARQIHRRQLDERGRHQQYRRRCGRDQARHRRHRRTNHPLIQEIIKELYDKGEGNGDHKNLEDVYCDTGIAIWSIAVEGARLAIKKDGWPLTPEKIKAGP